MVTTTNAADGKMATETSVRPITLRVKVGLNACSNLKCGYCHQEFNRGGLWLRMEAAATVVDVPLCEPCFAAGRLFETVVPFDDHGYFPLMLS